MNFRFLAVTCRSVTLETDDTGCCFAAQPYTITLDGAVLRNETRNVTTVFGLLPDTVHTLGIDCGGAHTEQTFTTRPETMLLDVRRFGAAGDGVTEDTGALQAAILACPAGGTVTVPKGTWRTASLFLKSDMTLWLQRGAVLLGVNDRSRYPVLPGMLPGANGEEYNLGTWEGNPLDCFAALITGISVQRVDLIGEGTLDADAQHGDWWQNAKVRRGAWRPFMLYLNHCTEVRVQGVTFQNSYSWTLHPYYSDRIGFYDVTVFNGAHSPNTDGIDPESCTHVEIVGCRISVGDDCIAIKSGKRYMSTFHPAPTRDIQVRNCLMERGHGSVVVGSEVSCGVYDVRVRQCIFRKTDRGLRIKTRRGRGEASVLDGIVLERICMEDVRMPFTVNMFYFCDPDGHSPYVQSTALCPVDKNTPRIGSIDIREVTCTGATASGGFFYGLPEMPIGRITLEDVSLSFAEKAAPEVPIMMDDLTDTAKLALWASNVSELSLRRVRVAGAEGEWPVLHGVQNYTAKELQNG